MLNWQLIPAYYRNKLDFIDHIENPTSSDSFQILLFLRTTEHQGGRNRATHVIK